MIDLELELDAALSRNVELADEIDRLRTERDIARRMAVECENDERRLEQEIAEKDDAIIALMRREIGRLAEVESLTIRNKDLELMLASRPSA